jgi:hypothetical protein
LVRPPIEVDVAPAPVVFKPVQPPQAGLGVTV